MSPKQPKSVSRALDGSLCLGSQEPSSTQTLCTSTSDTSPSRLELEAHSSLGPLMEGGGAAPAGTAVIPVIGAQSRKSMMS